MSDSKIDGKQRVNLIAFHAMSCPDGTRRDGRAWKKELADRMGVAQGVVTKLTKGWFTVAGPGVNDETIKKLCAIDDEAFLSILGHQHEAKNDERRSCTSNQSWLRKFAQVADTETYVDLCVSGGLRVRPELEEAAQLREEERAHLQRNADARWRADEQAYWHQRLHHRDEADKHAVPMHRSEIEAIQGLYEMLTSSAQSSKTAVVYAVPYSGIAHALQHVLPGCTISGGKYRGGIHHIHVGALEQPDGLKTKLVERLLGTYTGQTNEYENNYTAERKIAHILNATDALLVIHGASAIPEDHRRFVERLSDALEVAPSINIGNKNSRLILTVWERGAFNHLNKKDPIFYYYRVNAPRDEAIIYFNTALEHYRKIRGAVTNQPIGPRAESAILKRAEHHYRSKDTNFTEFPSAIRYRAFCASDTANASPFDPTQGVWNRIRPEWRHAVPEISDTLSDIQSDVRNFRHSGNPEDLLMLRVISTGLFFVTARMISKIVRQIGSLQIDDSKVTEHLRTKYVDLHRSEDGGLPEKYTTPLLVRSIIQDDWIRFGSKTRSQIHDAIGETLEDMIVEADSDEAADEVPYQYPWDDSSVVLAVETIRHFCRAAQSAPKSNAIDLIRKALDIYDSYLEEGTFSGTDVEQGRQNAGLLSRSHGLQALKYEALCLLSADGQGHEAPLGCDSREKNTYFRELGITLNRMLRPKDAISAFEKCLSIGEQSGFDRSYTIAHAISANILLGDLNKAVVLLDEARRLEASEEDYVSREKIQSRNNARAAAIALAQGRRQRSRILWGAGEDDGIVPFQGDRSIGYFDTLLSSPNLLRKDTRLSDKTWAMIEHASHAALENGLEHERLRVDIRKASFARILGFPITAEALLDHVGLDIARHSGAEILFREFQIESAETLRSLNRPRYAFVAYAWPAFQSLRRRSAEPLLRKTRALCAKLLGAMPDFVDEPVPAIASKRFWTEISRMSEINQYPLFSVDLLPAISDVEKYFLELAVPDSRETYMRTLRQWAE